MINTKRLTVISVVILVLVAVMTVTMIVLRPGQFDAEIRKTVAMLEKGPVPDLTLAVFTDIHYDPSKQEPSTVNETCTTIRTIGKQLEKTNRRIDALWNLGDFINGHNTTKAQAVDQIRTVIDAQKKVTADFHNIEGNHDTNIHATFESNAGYPETEVLSVSELNAVLENARTEQTEHHNAKRLTDYYVDFPAIRVICVSADETTFMPETEAWLRNEALKTEREVLILSHVPTRPEWGFREDVVNGEAMEKAVFDFIAVGGTVIAWIHGHDHGDIVNTAVSDDGAARFYEVGIGCARFQFPTSNGTPGMTYWERNREDETMILFDIVTISQNDRIVRFTRVGAGEDREISY